MRMRKHEGTKKKKIIINYDIKRHIIVQQQKTKTKSNIWKEERRFKVK